MNVEKTADEMFEELEVKKECEDKDGIGYANYNDSILIEFFKIQKHIRIDTECATVEVLNAIYKKCEELGWI